MTCNGTESKSATGIRRSIPISIIAVMKKSLTEWVNWAHACIGIAMRWVTLRNSLLEFLLHSRKIQFSLDKIYVSFQVSRSMWQLIIHHSFHLSAVLVEVGLSGMTCAQPTIFPMLKTCNATATGAFLTCTSVVTGSQIPEFSVSW